MIVAVQVRALVEGYDEFIGIDHHKMRCQVMINDREGPVVKRGSVPTDRDALAAFIGERDGVKRLATYEAGPRYRPMHRWLGELVDRSVLANRRPDIILALSLSKGRMGVWSQGLTRY